MRESINPEKLAERAELQALMAEYEKSNKVEQIPKGMSGEQRGKLKGLSTTIRRQGAFTINRDPKLIHRVVAGGTKV